MRTVTSMLAVSVLSASLAQAAPAAPVVTVGADDIKQLQFDWSPVPQTNTYELWFRANPAAQWVKYATTIAQRPFFRIGISVHLLDFAAARYYVKACNPSGCSASNEVGVDGLAPDALGYLKPNGAGNSEWFGHHLAMSADGATLAVLTGEKVGTEFRSAVVHVYHRTSSTSGWRREARLLPSMVQSLTSDYGHGAPLALSADGNWLALGLFREDAPGVPDPADTGAVYLFHRDGITWTRVQKIAPPAPVAGEWFGWAFDLDDAGRTLAILNGHPGSATSPFDVEIYRRAADASTWSPAETIPSPPPVSGLRVSCEAFALSGSGKRLLRTCAIGGPGNSIVQVLESPTGSSAWTESARVGASGNYGIDTTYDGKEFITSVGRSLQIWAQSPTGWIQDGSGTLGIASCGPDSCAISRDGKLAAVGFPDTIGAVLVLERKGNGWRQRQWVRPDSMNAQEFGKAVALGANGRTLAVVAPFDPSKASGIDGDRADSSEPQRGAVWLY